MAAQHFKVIESSRGVRGIPSRGRNGNPTVTVTGGGVAIVYMEENFFVEDANIDVPEGIEAVWAILTPKKTQNEKVKKILVGGVYIAPRSLFKQKPLTTLLKVCFMYSLNMILMSVF